MSKDTDPDFAKSMDRAREVDAAYGNLGRHIVDNVGVEISHADAFVSAIERLHISSLPIIALIPRNLETSPGVDQLVYERESRDLQVLARQLGFTLDPLAGNELATIHENDATIILGGLYFAYEAIERINGFATLVEFFINVAKFFGSRRAKHDSEVELSQEVILGKRTTTVRLTYKGPASGLPDIVKLMQVEFEQDDDA